ncbi:alkaline phosphatase family protein [Nocardia rosealba]|uniref:alkaline phosphatase family protein n=1 Tax=Nocardia rosealba TaxID=2878563 RepID=UPI001CDA40DA|nr:alkaline phosphatase family protein [Nocardia rosealba]MCA2208043.1 alkaline phosphatase family protein [Nocardia rosealba]
MNELLLPRYGHASLADLLPSILACLGVPGEHDRLGLELDVDHVCVLLVDGLGATALDAESAAAPFLSGLPAATLDAGFPSTTATSLTTLGTGLPPGEHGTVGYTFHLPGQDRLFNGLRWQLTGDGPKVDAIAEFPPERIQPHRTTFERATAAGIAAVQVAPSYQDGSGLTRAGWRGGGFRTAFSVGDLVDGVLTALGSAPKSLVYTYHSDLDTTGHARGPQTRAWRFELANVDRIAAELAGNLPPRSALIVTADHGMVPLVHRIDFDTHPHLSEGVRALGGEPRARHVYTEAGATESVADTWTGTLGDEFVVRTKAQVIEAGWFGPRVHPEVAARIGDLVVVATGTSGVIRSGAEPLQSQMPGHHGSLTADELLVPLRIHRS